MNHCTTTDTIIPGMIVSLNGEWETPEVNLGTDNIYGVSVGEQDGIDVNINIGNEGTVLVSNINGAITSGDLIGLSPTPGVGALYDNQSLLFGNATEECIFDDQGKGLVAFKRTQ